MTDVLAAGGLVPDAIARRRFGVAGPLALLLHAALLAAILWWPRGAPPVDEQPPRLVFVEPAPPPPPPLGRPDGEGAAGEEAMSLAPGPGTVPEEKRPVELAKPKVANPRPIAKPKPEAKPVPKPEKPKPVKRPPEPESEPLRRVDPRRKPEASPREEAPVVESPPPVAEKPREERAAEPASPPAPADETSGVARAGAKAPRGVAQGSVGGVEGGVVGGVRGGTPGGVVGAAGRGPVSIGAVAQRPTLVRRVPPTYPPDARRRGLEGLVLLEAVLDVEGNVEPGVKVLQSVPELDRAAIEAVRQWRFQPARGRDGSPVRVILEIPIRFVLR
ncbi:TonB family protein [bacterium]|nr:TonB family protein [bacterium]